MILITIRKVYIFCMLIYLSTPLECQLPKGRVFLSRSVLSPKHPEECPKLNWHSYLLDKG